ncbi:hypothetical protein IWQ60_001573 [Tieghemiomyces parasiticus]|uniref:Mitochondrial ribosomal protein subunit L20-domain-containing protein n=1 Tax=Tieghemiomyces parasiticus TaxID=78921 RepID=A0A9W8AEE2_9FUNG|nr:hypothetical protein IWQ60_001573 [Tieghemiomyces parasiticus]
MFPTTRAFLTASAVSRAATLVHPRTLSTTATQFRKANRNNDLDLFRTLPNVVQPMPITPPASSTIAARRDLDDGSVFLARIPLDRPDPTTTPQLTEADLPPLLHPPRQGKKHITEAQKEEMRRLRNEDPVQWTSQRLAEKFDCNPVFVASIAPAPRSHIQNLCSKAEEAWEKKGWKRRLIAVNRIKRRALW